MFDIDTGQIADDIARGTDPDWENWSDHPNPDLCRHMLASQIQSALDDLVGIIRRMSDMGATDPGPAKKPKENPRQLRLWKED